MTKENRFNDLSGKEWLTFQKSWSLADDTQALYWENLRFFTQGTSDKGQVEYFGTTEPLLQQLCNEEQLVLNSGAPSHFALWDLRGRWTTVEAYLAEKAELLKMAVTLFERLEHHRFLGVLIDSVPTNGANHQIAWDFNTALGQIFTLKDEKLLVSKSTDTVAYALYFRKDDQSKICYNESSLALLENTKKLDRLSIPVWQIVRPKPRSHAALFHPASFPCELAAPFIEQYSCPGDLVFDPMCGSGSTLVAAINQKRRGLGVELNPQFVALSEERMVLETSDPEKSELICDDIRTIDPIVVPPVDYVFTSPPYWNVLNASGGAGQTKRSSQGLPTTYSEQANDLGNIPDYDTFLDELTKSYQTVWDCLKAGGSMTIVVKNFKRHGQNYHFASDLAERLVQDGWYMETPRFWLQDDIKLFPFGYRYTWVSNICHSYILTFQKPIKPIS